MAESQDEEIPETGISPEYLAREQRRNIRKWNSKTNKFEHIKISPPKGKTIMAKQEASQETLPNEETTQHPPKRKGWGSDLIDYMKQQAHDAINSLHDRMKYDTKAKKNAIKDALGEDVDEQEVNTGFQKAAANRK